MPMKRNNSALLAKYFAMYKKNPKSKVFAPLAESFRKLGMLDEALKVLREGIRYHPNYALGYIVLAHCYFDQQKYDLTYNTLRPIVGQNTDNVSLQKIFAQACVHLGHLEEALDTYKYLLFLNPRDRFFAEQVKKLEDDLLVGHKKLSLEQLVKAPDLPQLSAPATQDDDWVQVDFNPTPSLQQTTPAEDDPSEWSMQAPGASVHPILRQDRIEKRDLEDDFFADEFENEHGNIEEVNATSVSSESPIVSHTLIDLYCSQHYYDKAIELLQKILELNPQDQASRKKLEQVMAARGAHAKTEAQESSESDGHDELIAIIESKVKAPTPAQMKLRQSFDEFLALLHAEAQHHR
jgi:tetratricopeptide (TPR) repeat protein